VRAELGDDEGAVARSDVVNDPDGAQDVHVLLVALQKFAHECDFLRRRYVVELHALHRDNARRLCRLVGVEETAEDLTCRSLANRVILVDQGDQHAPRDAHIDRSIFGVRRDRALALVSEEILSAEQQRGRLLAIIVAKGVRRGGGRGGRWSCG
jgi:hypothetical protein